MNAVSRPWPADRVGRRPLAELLPYAQNARTHTDHQIGELARSIQEFGWTFPVLIDPASNIIAGHGRVLAAQRLGITDVPIMVAEGWSPAQIKAYRIADNQHALNAGWNMALLGAEFSALQSVGFDTTLTGFTAAEIAGFLGGNAGLTDPDAIPPAPEAPTTRPGDLWRLGPHVLVCGSATDPDAVQRLLTAGNAQPNLMVTDPPYGVDYDPDWRSKQGPVAATLRHHKPGAVGKVVNDTRVDWRAAWKLYGGDIAYVWHAGVLPHEAALSLIDSGFTIRSQIIWAKRHFAVSRGHYHHQHEPCLYVIRKGKSGNWQGGRGQSTLWDIDKPTRSETGHSAQKPVDCMKRPIDNHTVTGDSVYDPFVGSGSTIIACELTARRCLAIEIEPLHCDVAIARWEQFTGQKATLSGD